MLHEALPLLDDVAEQVLVEMENCCEGCEDSGDACSCKGEEEAPVVIQLSDLLNINEPSNEPRIVPVIIRTSDEEEDYDFDDGDETIECVCDPWEEELSMVTSGAEFRWVSA